MSYFFCFEVSRPELWISTGIKTCQQANDELEDLLGDLEG